MGSSPVALWQRTQEIANTFGYTSRVKLGIASGQGGSTGAVGQLFGAACELHALPPPRKAAHGTTVRAHLRRARLVPYGTLT